MSTRRHAQGGGGAGKEVVEGRGERRARGKIAAGIELAAEHSRIGRESRLRDGGSGAAQRLVERIDGIGAGLFRVVGRGRGALVIFAGDEHAGHRRGDPEADRHRHQQFDQRHASVLHGRITRVVSALLSAARYQKTAST